MHRILLREVIVDVPEAAFAASVDFWAAALDARAVPGSDPDHPEFTSLQEPASVPHVGVQRLGSGEARFHLDLESDDIEAEVARLTGLGARVVQRMPSWVVLADPSGLLLCVLPPESAEFATRSRAVS